MKKNIQYFMLSIQLFSATVALGNTPFEGVLTMHSEPINRSEKKSTIVYYFRAGDVRVESETPLTSTPTVTLMSGKNPTKMTIVNPAKKTFLEIDTAVLTAMSGGLNAAFGLGKLSIKQLGTKTVGRYQTQHVQAVSQEFKIDCFMTQDLGTFDLPAAMLSNGNNDCYSISKEAGVKGIAVLVETKTPKGKLIASARLGHVEKRSLDVALFETPKGYQKETGGFSNLLSGEKKTADSAKQPTSGEQTP